MAIDWSKLDTAAKKQQRANEQVAQAAEVKKRKAFKGKVKGDVSYAEITALAPENIEAYIEDKIKNVATPSKEVIRFLMRVAIATVRNFD